MRLRWCDPEILGWHPWPPPIEAFGPGYLMVDLVRDNDCDCGHPDAIEGLHFPSCVTQAVAESSEESPIDDEPKDDGPWNCECSARMAGFVTRCPYCGKERT